ncbi:MAG: alpha/beta fold hydrolase [Shimia sp.]
MDLLPGFDDQRIPLSTGVTLRVRQAGKGAPVVLLHGYPQTHLCWHRVAPALVEAGYRVILPDLRGYGDSDAPEEPVAFYSKRNTATDIAALLDHLGIEKAAIAGHDRGARVAHRFARDHKARTAKVAVLDIAPTAEMYGATDMAFATGYYHWFFLIQPAPLPERMIGADPAFYLRSKIGAWSKGNDAAFDPAAVAEYIRCFDDRTIHASCQDYRASATIDLEHDAAETARVDLPLLVLWGAKGLVGRTYDMPGIWRGYFRDVTGHALPCGHFLPEEQPDATAHALLAFLASAQA